MVEDNDLDEVSGGVLARRREALRKDIINLIPENLRAKVGEARSNVEMCKLLAENGVDIELIEDKIKDCYAKMKINVLELKETELETVIGGFDGGKYGEVRCWKCGASDRDDLSYQFWASSFLADGRIYRCKKCKHYMHYKDRVSVEIWNENTYNDWVKDHI